MSEQLRASYQTGLLHAREVNHMSDYMQNMKPWTHLPNYLLLFEVIVSTNPQGERDYIL